MGDVDTTAVVGVEARGYRRGTASTDSWDQYAVKTKPQIVSYLGRASTFRVPGAGTTAPVIVATIHNATGSSVLVDVTRVVYDCTSTATKTMTNQVPVIFLHRLTVLPTGGTALTKVPMDTGLTSSSSVTLLGGASADRVESAITATLPTSTWLDSSGFAKMHSLAQQESHDPTTFTGPITLRALEGIAVSLDDKGTVGSPSTDWSTASIEWVEYTQP